MSKEVEAQSHADAKAAARAAYPIGAREFVAVSAMLLMYVAAQALSILLMRPFAAAGVKGFENPEDPKNGVWLIATILVFTGIILFIAKIKKEKFIQGLILGATGLTLVYVFFPLFWNYVPLLMDSFYYSIAVSLILAAILTWLLFKFPEWYIVDTVGVLVAAGGIAIFGSSFTPLTYLVVLFGTAIYDYISVYKTKHMLSLADSVLNYHLPIMLVVPKHLDYSFLQESTQLRKEADQPAPAPVVNPMGTTTAPVKKPRDAMFLGLGDIVIPSIFALTALAPRSGGGTFSTYAAMGALLGTVGGFLFLMAYVLRGKPQAGLPALNGGAFLGFVAGYYLQFHSWKFWA